MTRPRRLVVVTGTGTEVGKTWVTARLAELLVAAGRSVAVRKPAQSFARGDRATDADVLAAATGEAPSTVCPPDRGYEVAMAPPMAAAVLGRPPFTIADLAVELTWADGIDVGLVEGAGGPRSPLASDGDTVGLAASLAPDLVVLVADAGLGTINAVRLSVAPFADIAPACVILNRYDPTDDLHVRNGDWLATHAGLDVVVDTQSLIARVLGVDA
jgi:dethiobiotin synthetase